ncbi:MAG: hypothetical protein A2119_02810 [Candidatus Colwellbacteria bacterium GWA2_46_10]|uniref:Capsule synthesis protein CapA domain-containing protein n=1 Tax=Candidatus Colwellbacteria bacterium GWA2_46_10 TaxID=1797684 RepID=A0A1G1YXJ2_9BACT|nr:MAG: hypothetical protein A2119_02810 [Candidatus Colwellbacteria bacterium GWA2_46_10]
MSIPAKRALLWVLLVVSTFLLGFMLLFIGKLLVIKAQIDRSTSVIGEAEERLAMLPDKPSRAVLLFVGDIMLSRSVGAKMEAVGDYRYPFLEIADILRSADLAFGNLEGPISDQGRNQGSIYSFRADPRVIEGLSYAGFDVLSLANNHIWDWGTDALLDTVSILERTGITPIGAGENYEKANMPALFEVGKTKVAILAYTNLLPKNMQAVQETPGLSDFDLTAIKELVSSLVSQGDLVVVSMHWGDEYETSANGVQKDIARGLIDAGADLVVGHHPHVIQELEQYGEGWIAYSLGNFVFDQSFSDETMRGAALRVELEGGNIANATLVPVRISPDFQASFRESNTP